jgi:hypothetical protein
MALVQESTNEEVIRVCKNLMQSGKINVYENPEQYIHHINRINKKPIYWYQSKVIEKK